MISLDKLACYALDTIDTSWEILKDPVTEVSTSYNILVLSVAYNKDFRSRRQEVKLTSLFLIFSQKFPKMVGPKEIQIIFKSEKESPPLILRL